jgi:hypothetical protein
VGFGHTRKHFSTLKIWLRFLALPTPAHKPVKRTVGRTCPKGCNVFRVYEGKEKFYIIDKFGKSIGAFNERYYADLFVALMNSEAAQQGSEPTVESDEPMPADKNLKACIKLL